MYITFKFDISEIYDLPRSLRRANRLANLLAMHRAMEYLRAKVVEELPDVYGRLRRAVKTFVSAKGNTLIGRVFIAKRSGGPGRTTTDIYGEHVEEGTKAYSAAPPIWPLRLWVVRKFGTRGKKAWRRAKGLQKSIQAKGTVGQHAFAKVGKREKQKVLSIFQKAYDEIYSEEVR